LNQVKFEKCSQFNCFKKQWNLASCGADNTKLKEDQYTASLSLTLAVTSFEILSMVFGLSIYSNLQTFLSMVLHFAGVIALFFFMFYRFCTDGFWAIFAICAVLPFITEIITIFRICICKKLPVWL
jgi:hypothetical protein